MKNISKKLSKFTGIAFLLLALGTLYLYPIQTYRVSERRADYFIVKEVNTGKIKIGSAGNIFNNRSENPIGTFKVIDVYQNECLCLIESVEPGINIDEIHRVSFINLPEQAIKNLSLSSKPGADKIIVKGIRFSRLSDHKEYYLSLKPVPAHAINPLNIAGIKKILFQIEEETDNRFSADLLSLAHINQLGLEKRLDFSDKERIFLGAAAGKLVMIYEEGNILQHMEISSAALAKFKENMFFFIILKKK